MAIAAAARTDAALVKAQGSDVRPQKILRGGLAGGAQVVAIGARAVGEQDNAHRALGHFKHAVHLKFIGRNADKLFLHGCLRYRAEIQLLLS